MTSAFLRTVIMSCLLSWAFVATGCIGSIGNGSFDDGSNTDNNVSSNNTNNSNNANNSTDATDDTDPDVTPPEPEVACTGGMLWPVQSPLKQLTNEEILSTLSAVFYGDPSAIYTSEMLEGRESLAAWIQARIKGTLRALPSASWGQDSFTNGLKAPSVVNISSTTELTTWFLDQKWNSDPIGRDAMFGEGEARMFVERLPDGTDRHHSFGQGWSPCTPERDTSIEDAVACGEQIVDTIVPRLLRRPFDSAEEAQTHKDYIKAAIEQTAQEEQGTQRDKFVRGVRQYMRGLLQTPAFLYKIERGQPTPLEHEQSILLTSFELASRLSYFFWQSSPDDELWAAAQNDGLLDPAKYEAQARRLMAHPRARNIMNDFFRGWLKLDKIDNIDLNQHHPHLAAISDASPLYVHASDANCGGRNMTGWRLIRRDMIKSRLQDALSESVRRHIDWAFWEEDSFAALLDSPKIFSNTLMSMAYGLPEVTPPQLPPFEFDSTLGGPCGPADDAKSDARNDEYNRWFKREFERLTARYEQVDMPADQRRGLLTHPAIVAMSSHDGKHSPIFRGVHVMNSLLCTKLPAPPPDMEPDDAPPEGTPCTTRQKTFMRHSYSMECATCHVMIDNIGFAFEHYDANGFYQTEENIKFDDINQDCPVDASVEVPRGLFGQGQDGSYPDGSSFGAAFTQNEKVKTCMVEHWTRYARGTSKLGETATPAQYTCEQQQANQLVQALDAGGGSMQELVIALVNSPLFKQKALSKDGGAP